MNKVNNKLSYQSDERVIEISHIIWNIVFPVMYPDDESLIEDTLDFLKICDAFFPIAKIGIRRLHALITKKTEREAAASIAIATVVSTNCYISLGRCIEVTPNLLPCINQQNEAIIAWDLLCELTNDSIQPKCMFERILKSQGCELPPQSEWRRGTKTIFYEYPRMLRLHIQHVRCEYRDRQLPDAIHHHIDGEDESSDSTRCTSSGTQRKYIRNCSLYVSKTYINEMDKIIGYNILDGLRLLCDGDDDNDCRYIMLDIPYVISEKKKKNAICVRRRSSTSSEGRGVLLHVCDALTETFHEGDLATSVVIICLFGKYIRHLSVIHKRELLCAAVASRSQVILHLAIVSLGIREVNRFDIYSKALETAIIERNVDAFDKILIVSPKYFLSVLMEQSIVNACINNSALIAKEILKETPYVYTWTQEIWDTVLIRGCSSGSIETLKVIFPSSNNNNGSNLDRQVSTHTSRQGVELAVSVAINNKKLEVVEWIFSQDGVKTQTLLLNILASLFTHESTESSELIQWFSKRYNIQIDTTSPKDRHLVSLTIQPIEPGDLISTRYIDLDDRMDAID